MPIVAHKLLEAFDKSIAYDQGNRYRHFLKIVLPHLEDAYRQDDGNFRTHLGASVIGGECPRDIWYGFRWATKPKFDGRMLRLFNRGHLEEGRIIALLLCSGLQVFQQDENGHQFRISDFGGHFGGSGDGVVIGIPDLPDAATPALLEVKTHNDASFKSVKKDGVRSSKLEHFVQMNTYCNKMKLLYALYIAVNKNTDEIYAEIVPHDQTVSGQFIERAKKIIPMHLAPAKISKSPGWRTCAWCDHKPVCHLKATPERNCRTCQFSVAKEDGKWWCENKERQMTMLFGPSEGVSIAGEDFSLSKARQLQGCNFYTLHEEFGK